MGAEAKRAHADGVAPKERTAMAKETEISTATAADIAADVESHRRAYHGFTRLMTFAAAGTAVVLVIVFLILN